MKAKAKFLEKINKNKKESVTKKMINGVDLSMAKIYGGSKTSKTYHINEIYLKMKMGFEPKVIYLILLYILTLYLKNTVLQH